MNKVLLIVQKAVLALLRLTAAILARVNRKRFAPRIDFPQPSGRHKVGVRDMEFVDLNQREASSWQPRHLMARVWYPASPAPEASRRALFDAREAAAMLRGMTAVYPFSAAQVRELGASLTWSFQDAPVDAGASPCPLVIFSHGLGGYLSQNSHLCEHLASHGYVVASLAHPGATSAVPYPSGEPAFMPPLADLMGPEPMQAGMQVARARTTRERFAGLIRQATVQSMSELSSTWAADIASLLDHLTEGAPDAGIADVIDHIDLSRVAVMGMSLGGSASCLAGHMDSRISTIVNLDGGQWGRELINTQIRIPLLLLHCESALFEDGSCYNDYAYEPAEQLGDSGLVERLVVRHSGHVNFTDLSHYHAGFIRRVVGLRDIEGPRMLALTAELCQRWLDARLRGHADAWPQNPLSLGPELTRGDPTVAKAALSSTPAEDAAQSANLITPT